MPDDYVKQIQTSFRKAATALKPGRQLAINNHIEHSQAMYFANGQPIKFCIIQKTMTTRVLMRNDKERAVRAKELLQAGKPCVGVQTLSESERVNPGAERTAQRPDAVDQAFGPRTSVRGEDTS